MTASTGSSPTRSRLALSDSFGLGPLDGAWWPRSRDLQAEVSALVDQYPKERGHIDRLLYSRPDWDSTPRKITAERGFVKLGGFPEDDSHLMVISLSSAKRVRLLVIPFDTDPTRAEALLRAASGAGNVTGAGDLLAARPDAA
jgi:hypothetical protein